MNAREILFGPNPLRKEFLESFSGRATPSTQRWIAVQQRRLDGWMTKPQEQLRLEVREGRLERSTLDVMRWLGFRDLHARMQHCLVMAG
jgi:hypothetical protein